MPAFRLFQKKVSQEHHDKVKYRQYIEHVYDTYGADQCRHNGTGNNLCKTEARYRQTGCQAFLLTEPQHQRLDRGEITQSQADSHHDAIEKVDTDQGTEVYA